MDGQEIVSSEQLVVRRYLVAVVDSDHLEIIFTDE